MKACLGVVDMVYGYGDAPSATTFAVAQALQERYQLFSRFYHEHQDLILNTIQETLTLQLVNHLRYGAPFEQDDIILGAIVEAFSLFLEREEMAGLQVDGVPTLAALEGINTRLKIHHGPRRPSFIDGGLFLSSFNAWISLDA